eukprot:3368798-Prymnesium_polylepis.1
MCSASDARSSCRASVAHSPLSVLVAGWGPPPNPLGTRLPPGRNERAQWAGACVHGDERASARTDAQRLRERPERSSVRA